MWLGLFSETRGEKIEATSRIACESEAILECSGVVFLEDFCFGGLEEEFRLRFFCLFCRSSWQRNEPRGVNGAFL